MLCNEETIEKSNIKISFKENKICTTYKNFKFQFDEEGKLVENFREEFLNFIFEVEKETKIEIEENKSGDETVTFKLNKIKEWFESFLEGLNSQAQN